LQKNKTITYLVSDALGDSNLSDNLHIKHFFNIPPTSYFLHTTTPFWSLTRTLFI